MVMGCHAVDAEKMVVFNTGSCGVQALRPQFLENRRVGTIKSVVAQAPKAVSAQGRKFQRPERPQVAMSRRRAGTWTGLLGSFEFSRNRPVNEAASANVCGNSLSYEPGLRDAVVKENC
jgi:hypothetical protein